MRCRNASSVAMATPLRMIARTDHVAQSRMARAPVTSSAEASLRSTPRRGTSTCSTRRLGCARLHPFERIAESVSARALALRHLGPAATPPVDQRARLSHEITRGDPLCDQVVADADEELRFVVV